MQSKPCITCKKTLPLTSFYKHPQMADGYLNKCKECQKACSKSARGRNPDQYRDYDKSRANRPDRVAARKSYAQTPEGKQAKARAMKAYQQRYPMRRAAHVITGNAIRDGRLVKPEQCECCTSTIKIEAHHDDYTKPLDVRWLCEVCHKDWHRNNQPIYS